MELTMSFISKTWKLQLPTDLHFFYFIIIIKIKTLLSTILFLLYCYLFLIINWFYKFIKFIKFIKLFIKLN